MDSCRDRPAAPRMTRDVIARGFQCHYKLIYFARLNDAVRTRDDRDNAAATQDAPHESTAQAARPASANSRTFEDTPMELAAPVTAAEISDAGVSTVGSLAIGSR